MDTLKPMRRPLAMEDFFKAWFAVFAALYPAIVIGGLGCGIAFFLGAPSLRAVPMILYVGIAAAIYAIFLAPAFAILALPLIPMRQAIAGRRFPWLKPGYAVVALYGVIFVLAINQWRFDAMAWMMLGMYELIALAATLIYIPIATGLDLFAPADPAERAKAQ